MVKVTTEKPRHKTRIFEANEEKRSERMVIEERNKSRDKHEINPAGRFFANDEEEEDAFQS